MQPMNLRDVARIARVSVRTVSHMGNNHHETVDAHRTAGGVGRAGSQFPADLRTTDVHIPRIGMKTGRMIGTAPS